jgi:hypothetical protein
MYQSSYLGIDCKVLVVRIVPNQTKNMIAVVVSLLFIVAVAGVAQDKNPDSNSKTVHLTIAVTGGEGKKPVDNASVYVKYVQERMVMKNKKIEMNLKTNLSGLCHVPEIPSGKVLIQVIAEGWKTYGEYFEVNQAEQTINISLVRPPKWY